MNELDLAIIIVTYNSAPVIKECLDTLGNSLQKNIYLIDNHSRDATLEIAGRYDINIYTLPVNIGFGRAANFGARKARQKFLCFLNPDCIAEKELLLQGVEMLSQNFFCGAVPKLIGEGNNLNRGRQPGYSRLKLISDMLHTNYGYNLICRGLERLPGYHDHSWYWPHGACFFISKNDFAASGGFNPDYFMYMEDVDWGRRFALKGGKILEIEACLLHKEGQGAEISNHQRQTLLNRARRLYATHNYGTIFAGLLGLLALPALILRFWRELSG